MFKKRKVKTHVKTFLHSVWGDKQVEWAQSLKAFLLRGKDSKGGETITAGLKWVKVEEEMHLNGESPSLSKCACTGLGCVGNVGSVTQGLCRPRWVRGGLGWCP